jgi:hypothetical protein
LRDTGRIGRETALEVGVHGNVGRRNYLLQVRNHHVARHTVVRTTLRPGEASAGGGECLEAEALQKPRAAHIPRIRNDETAALMQALKGAPLVCDARTRFGHIESPSGDSFYP